MSIMDDKSFWLHIKKIEDDPLLNHGLSKNEIIDFYMHLENKLAESYTFSLMEACFVICSYISDDLFADFQAFLIMQGKERFYYALNNPDTIANWLEVSQINNIEIEGQKLLFYSIEIYVSLGGTEDEFYKKITYVEKPKVIMEWPENKEMYKTKYPVLIEKFWNQELIRELHGTANNSVSI